ncbi:hypothetical protein GCM10007874_31040 [Labrys miyagiensis]|uniref:Uncharacterized protein n=1 Tax=Labrys miyagiensis TaxID=346912 RepID=A0ABQ6CIB4_9HYPH|nr:hypothetical protein [Labrys miyagiensis]GLS20087.1 hypothetical protein GCM10007874_31040 [Labrys miyagiensis]
MAGEPYLFRVAAAAIATSAEWNASQLARSAIAMSNDVFAIEQRIEKGKLFPAQKTVRSQKPWASLRLPGPWSIVAKYGQVERYRRCLLLPDFIAKPAQFGRD